MHLGKGPVRPFQSDMDNLHNSPEWGDRIHSVLGNWKMLEEVAPLDTGFPRPNHPIRDSRVVPGFVDLEM